MQKNIIETLMGAVVLGTAGVFLAFAYNGSGMRMEDGYGVNAKFANAAGIGLGSDVRIGGVKIGTVSDISLDAETYEAVVKMSIRNSTLLPKDSSAAVVSSGLLGEKFVQVTPGGDEKMMKDGDRIDFTQSAVNLEELIGKFMFSGGGVDKDKDKAPAVATGTP